MNAQQAITILTQEESSEAAAVLSLVVRPLCKENTTGLINWLADGEFDISSTPKSLAIEWDVLVIEANRAKLRGW